MFTRRSSLSGLVASMTLALVLTGCGPETAGGKGKAGSGTKSEGSGSVEVSNIEGTIKINGSSTVQPISDAVAEEFVKQFPGVNVVVDGAGTGNGFKEFQQKSTDISDASRPIKPGEFAKCQENGVTFIEVPVAYDGLTIAIHKDNDWVETLTVDQLKAMFLGDSAAKKWSDVDPGWPEETIEFFVPGNGSGTYDYFREVVKGKGDVELRKDMTPNEEDNVLVNGIAGNKFAIGFFGVSYYEQNKDKLRAVKIVSPKDGQAYLPSMENIESGAYAPFSRPLFIYVSTASLGRAEVKAFVDFYLANVSEICERVKYVRLPSEVLAQGVANLENEVSGTHFIDSEGNKREGTFLESFTAENLTN
ncbi:MAG: PstS family phosphate ABC transporter substrate-binding protein [Planctomycetota bacterium]